MTMCASKDDRQPQQRGPRSLMSRELQLAAEATSALDDQYDQYGPPECNLKIHQFNVAERVVGIIAKLGLSPALPTVVIDGTPTDVAGPINTVLQWCAQCPLRAGCYEQMTVVPGYTGIAGGVILLGGKPYSPRKGRVKKTKRATKHEEEVTDGLW
jgi:hypothetical protein